MTTEIATRKESAPAALESGASGWTFEADPYGDEFYPCPCPLGAAYPTLHNDGRTI